MKSRGRAGMLAVIMIVLAVLVVLDRARPSGDDAGTTTGTLGAARDEYIREVSALRREQAEVAEREGWERALEQARSRRAELDGRLLAGQTRDLAADRLRRLIQQEMRALGLNENTLQARQLPPATPQGAALPIQIVSSEVSFSSVEPGPVYQLIERLENLSGVRTMISGVRITGPGRKQDIPGQVDVTLAIHALAVIGKEG